MNAVTHSTKCYIFQCVGCGALEESSRKDTLTCSPACRVRAHRNGSLKALHALAKGLDIPPAVIQHAKAIVLLAPELEPEIRAGKLTISAAMPTVCIAFNKLVMRLESERTA